MDTQLLCRLSALCDGLLPLAGAAIAFIALGAVFIAA